MREFTQEEHERALEQIYHSKISPATLQCQVNLLRDALSSLLNLVEVHSNVRDSVPADRAREALAANNPEGK